MKNVAIFLLFCLSLNVCTSQEDPIEDPREIYKERKNIPKFAPTGLVFGNFQFQYERVLNRKFSMALTYSTIPQGDLPFKDVISKAVESEEEEDDINRYIENTSLKYSSFTPELRIYFGDGYGKGFYLAPFYRHSEYSIKDIEIYYDSDSGGEETMDTKGNISTNTFGLQIGSQFNLGSRLVLDWFIIGPHYGSGKGDLVGITEESLTENEQENLSGVLDEIDFPIGDFSHEVNSKGAKINIDGPWGGIRAGLALGYRF